MQTLATAARVIGLITRKPLSIAGLQAMRGVSVIYPRDAQRFESLNSGAGFALPRAKRAQPQELSKHFAKQVLSTDTFRAFMRRLPPWDQQFLRHLMGEASA